MAVVEGINGMRQEETALEGEILERSFFDREITEVAVGLLGKVLRRTTPEGAVAVRLTEVEAYAGELDPASHSYRGRTQRNAVMFGEPGHAYVYFTYGMHFCVNLVCGPEGMAAAVLLRAGEIIEGAELARARRNGARDRDLARGPARLCQALAIDRSLNGSDVCVPGGLAIHQGAPVPAELVCSGPRTGVTSAHDTPWRFWVEGEPSVSPYRRHTPRQRRLSITVRGTSSGTLGLSSAFENGTTVTDIVDDLQWRGLLAQTTDEEALRATLSAGPVTYYCGFDPTAPSLHVGNLVQLLTMRRLQDAGHRPLALVGGATGLIGDPSGRSSERQLNSTEVVAGWVKRIQEQVARFLSFEGDNAARMVNNLDWTGPMSVIDFLRDIGKHFPVNKMLAREVVASRLETGLSYTEFSYQLLQSMDFLELHRRYGCLLQSGGSDQWGNLTAGADLIRRVTGHHVHAIATPLLTKPDGTKYGKTAGGAIWLDPELTSPYAFFQYWVNVEDSEVGKLLRTFSFRSREEIEDLEKQSAERPAARIGQRALAEELTTLVHSAEETAKVIAASAALFGQGGLDALDERILASALAEAPQGTVPAGELPSIADLLVTAGLCKSKSEARRTITQGGAYLNNAKVESEDAAPTAEDLLHGRFLVLRRGKRNVGSVVVG